MIERELLIVFTCPRHGLFIDPISTDGWCQYPPCIWHVGDGTSDVHINKWYLARGGWCLRSGHCWPISDVCLSQGQISSDILEGRFTRYACTSNFGFGWWWVVPRLLLQESQVGCQHTNLYQVQISSFVKFFNLPYNKDAYAILVWNTI